MQSDKYNFASLDKPGKSMEVFAEDGKNLRTSAAMWGNRYGIFLSVQSLSRKQTGGWYKVTRNETRSKRSPAQIENTQRLRELNKDRERSKRIEHEKKPWDLVIRQSYEKLHVLFVNVQELRNEVREMRSINQRLISLIFKIVDDPESQKYAQAVIKEFGVSEISTVKKDPK